MGLARTVRDSGRALAGRVGRPTGWPGRCSRRGTVRRGQPGRRGVDCERPRAEYDQAPGTPRARASARCRSQGFPRARIPCAPAESLHHEPAELQPRGTQHVDDRQPEARVEHRERDQKREDQAVTQLVRPPRPGLDTRMRFGRELSAHVVVLQEDRHEERRDLREGQREGDGAVPRILDRHADQGERRRQHLLTGWRGRWDRPGPSRKEPLIHRERQHGRQRNPGQRGPQVADEHEP